MVSQKFYRVVFTLAIILALVLGLNYFTGWISRTTGYLFGEEEKVKLAHCLTENGVEFYGSIYCADCVKQKKLFEGAFEFIEEIDCGEDKELCPNIQEIPAWYINDSIQYGFKELSELKELSGCEVR